MKLQIKLTLKSDGTFGRGDGVAGLVDQDVEHDAETGLPFMRGRTLKGLLAEECANILFSLGKQGGNAADRLQKAAGFLFGKPGSTLDDDGHMHVGAASLPDDLRKAVEADLKAEHPRYTPADVLESLTTIRKQTAVDTITGAPDEGSLRSTRTVLRELTFTSELDFDEDPHDDAKALLRACVLSLRRAGTGRNRGRGRLKAQLSEDGKDITKEQFDRFREIVEGASK